MANLRNAPRLLILFFLITSGACLPEMRGKAALVERERGGRSSLQRASTPLSNAVSVTPSRGGDTSSSSSQTSCFAWFKPGATRREKQLAFYLLLWNSIALIDAIFYTFRPRQNLDGYLVGEWGPHALAQTRMLANCQLALIASVALIAFTGDERTIKNAFKILILATLGAFRAIYAGVQEGTIKAPWKTGYAAVMSLPPLLLLSYFAFVF